MKRFKVTQHRLEVARLEYEQARDRMLAIRDEDWINFFRVQLIKWWKEQEHKARRRVGRKKR